MIDIHAHILPGIDDGAPDAEHSLAMARAAAAEGIRKIIATPHHANGVYTNPAGRVREAVAELNALLEREGIPLEVLPGQEIRVHNEMLDAWARGELLTLADSPYILLEMPSSRIPSKMFEWVHELRLLGLHPIIAHPERNAAIVKEPRRLGELIEAGCYGQVTTHSLLGGFGRKIEECAWTLCRSGMIQFLASDAHHLEHRGFRMKEALESLARNVEDRMQETMVRNSSNIVGDEAIIVETFSKVNVKWWRKLSNLFQ
ncbi:tyrosine-protein phosphatase [Cohnella fermenti]|uniref:Tyrosine-protein phosphatase n=1 Tax=Cohnella fermenti TaxID=2565925 RepID=A0A4V3WFM1_9BACL|nr:CpsB/CapC family capsule biosynthesis tyrosine phosphatase [Cohnella fermenti]THF80842.1 protein tyrosine phosphatase [Cohnella fermenti]